MVCLLIDLFVAFDRRQSNFTKKLEYYGIADNNLRWFGNYLKDRKQFISFENNTTKKTTVTCGVPQGSILGRLLLLLLVNDLHHSSKLLNLIMFADDTNLFFPYSDTNILFEKNNKELINVSNWFNANKLSLNVKKPSIIFSTNNQKKIIFRCGFRL